MNDPVFGRWYPEYYGLTDQWCLRRYKRDPETLRTLAEPFSQAGQVRLWRSESAAARQAAILNKTLA